jgi:hypothetical protein
MSAPRTWTLFGPNDEGVGGPPLGEHEEVGVVELEPVLQLLAALSMESRRLDDVLAAMEFIRETGRPS